MAWLFCLGSKSHFGSNVAINRALMESTYRLMTFKQLWRQLPHWNFILCSLSIFKRKMKVYFKMWLGSMSPPKGSLIVTVEPVRFGQNWECCRPLLNYIFQPGCKHVRWNVPSQFLKSSDNLLYWLSNLYKQHFGNMWIFFAQSNDTSLMIFCRKESICICIQPLKLNLCFEAFVFQILLFVGNMKFMTNKMKMKICSRFLLHLLPKGLEHS